MAEYIITFEQTETFYIIVNANNETKATQKAKKEWSKGLYNENGDRQTKIEDITKMPNYNKSTKKLHKKNKTK